MKTGVIIEEWKQKGRDHPMSVKVRDEFSASTKKLLAGRAGHLCSKPEALPFSAKVPFRKEGHFF
jgi:hypothetical protein